MRTIFLRGEDRIGAVRIYAIFMACVLLSLFLFALGEVPKFHPDGYSYIHAAIHWPRDEIGIVHSWIGSRHLAIWIYHLAFEVFGLNLDSLVIALAVLKLLTALSLTVVTASIIRNMTARVVVSVFAVFIVFYSPIMSYPATDNVALTLLSILWAVWTIGSKSKSKIILLGALPFLIGIAYSIRMEIVLFSLTLIVFYIFRERPKFSLPSLVLCCISLGLGILVPTILWSTWVPEPQPASYNGAIAVYRPITEYGVGTNGPASARLADILGIDVNEPISISLYRQALDETYSALGPAESNKLITAVGLEAIRTHALAIGLSGLGNAWQIINLPGSFDLAPADRALLKAALRTQLSDIDRPNQPIFPISRLTDSGLRSITWIQEILPRMRLSIQLPGTILLLSIAVSVLAAVRQRDPLWLGAPIFGVVSAVMAGISQGPTFRYIEPALVLNFVSMAAAVEAVLPPKSAFLSRSTSTFPSAVSLRVSRLAIILALPLCFFAATGFWHQIAHGLVADDSNLWLYFASHKIAHPVEGRDFEDAVIDASFAGNAGLEGVVRLQQRQDSWMNYVAPVSTWNLLQKALPSPATTAGYPSHLGRTIPLMFAVTAVIAWLVLISVLMVLRDPRFMIAAALALGVLALLSLVPQSGSTQTLMTLDWPSPFLENVIHFLVNPGHGFSIFGFTPRSYLAVLVVALFALRWSGVATRWVYLFSLPLFGVHASLALLLLIHLVALDLVRQRAVLRDWLVILLVAIGSAYGLLHQTVGPTVASSSLVQATLASFFILLLVAILANDPLSRLRRLWPRRTLFLDKAGIWLSQRSPWGGDLLLLVLFWVVTYPVVWLISEHATSLDNPYFWHQLHGLAIGLLLSVFYFGAALYVVNRFPTFRWPLFVALVALAWSLGFAYESRAQSPFWERLTGEALQIERALSSRETINAPPGFVFNEAVVYYALGQMLTMKNDRLDDLRQTAQDPWAHLIEPPQNSSVSSLEMEREQRPERERRAERERRKDLRGERGGAVATPGPTARADTAEH